MSLLNQVISGFNGSLIWNFSGFVSSGVAEGADEADKQADETVEDLAGDLAGDGVVISSDAFSKTGKITAVQRLWIENLNPSYALFNCQRTAQTAAKMLETGAMTQVSIKPIAYCNISNLEKHFPEMILDLAENRGCFKTRCSRDKLDQLMVILGEGTHAIIDLTSKIFSRTGHLLNYALVTNDDGQGQKLELIDAYGGSYTKMARENVDGYFASYEAKITAMVFYNKTSQTSSFVNEMLKGTYIEHITKP